MKQVWTDVWAIVAQLIAGTSHYVGVYASIGKYAENAVNTAIAEAEVEAARDLAALKNL